MRFISTMALAIAVAACGQQTSTPLHELFQHDLTDDRLGENFVERLNFLSDDPREFVAELEQAGFKGGYGIEGFLDEDTTSSCPRWDYPQDDTGLWAQVHACHIKQTGEVRLRRYGASRKSEPPGHL